MDNTWEIMQIINCYNEATKDMDRFSNERETLDELYAQALRIQCREDGLVVTLDDFIEDVNNGCFNDYDGHGYFLDFEGNRHDYVRCYVEFLKKHKEEGEYPFVIWFNK